MAAPGLSLAAESGDCSVAALLGLLTEHRLGPASASNCCTRDTCGIFLNPGLETVSPAYTDRLSLTVPQGSPLFSFLNFYFLFLFF